MSVLMTTTTIVMIFSTISETCCFLRPAVVLASRFPVTCFNSCLETRHYNSSTTRRQKSSLQELGSMWKTESGNVDPVLSAPCACQLSPVVCSHSYWTFSARQTHPARPYRMGRRLHPFRSIECLVFQREKMQLHTASGTLIPAGSMVNVPYLSMFYSISYQCIIFTMYYLS